MQGFALYHSWPSKWDMVFLPWASQSSAEWYQVVAKRIEEPKDCLLLSQGMALQHLLSNKSLMETWLR